MRVDSFVGWYTDQAAGWSAKKAQLTESEQEGEILLFSSKYEIWFCPIPRSLH
jgi:hypothetical protein